MSESTPLPFPQSEGSANLYHAPAEELEFQFAEEFSKLQGKFAYCLDEGEMLAGVGPYAFQGDDRIVAVGKLPVEVLSLIHI